MMRKLLQSLIGLLVCPLFAACITSIDEALPYPQLPEITVATEFNLVASPAHPTAYLSAAPIAAGETVEVIGTDKNAAWLLVLHDNQLGWMPTFYSRTNVAVLKPAIVIEPLSDKCTKYAGATYALGEEWISTGSDSIIVVGSIYRPQSTEQFDKASLALNIDGNAITVESDYIHVQLTPSRALVLFAYTVAGLHKNDKITFEVADSANEAFVFQAIFFSDQCQQKADRLSIGVTKMLVQSSLPAQSDNQPQVESTNEIQIISHKSSNNECSIQPLEKCLIPTLSDGWIVGKIDYLSEGASWAKFETADPAILFYEDKFHLWFAGRAHNRAPYAIGYATSTDGITWEVHPSPVLLPGENAAWDRYAVAGPSVIMKNGQFIMYYHGTQDSQWATSIGLATSSDGIHWEKSFDNPIFIPSRDYKWMQYQVRDPALIFHDGKYKMWFTGGDGNTWQIGYAESQDGRDWVIPVRNPVLSHGSYSSWNSSGVFAPEVLLVGTIFHIWYVGSNQNKDNYRRIGHATSADGIGWNDNLNNPLFGPESSDKFANGGTAHPALLANNEGYYLWYTGVQDGKNDQHVGYTRSKNGINWLRK